jgi:hypothetical protein
VKFIGAFHDYANAPGNYAFVHIHVMCCLWCLKETAIVSLSTIQLFVLTEVHWDTNWLFYMTCKLILV